MLDPLRKVGPRRWVLALLVPLGGVAVWLVLWPEYLFRCGQEALQRRDFPQAQGAFERYLWYRPGSAAAHRLAAQAARRRGSVAEAEMHLAATEKLVGSTPEGALEGVLLNAQQGTLGGVEEQLWSLVAGGHSDSVSILESLTRGYLSVRSPRALDAADALLQREPDHPGGHLWWAIAAEALDHREEALPHYRRAVELDPEADEVRLHLADCLARLGQAREAEAQYSCVLRRTPADPAARYGLARCKYDAHQLEEARDLLEALLARAPDHIPALVERSRVAARLQGAAAAEVWLRRAVDQAPEDREAHRLLLVCLETQGKDAEAREVRSRLRQLQAERARVFHQMQAGQRAPRGPSAGAGE